MPCRNVSTKEPANYVNGKCTGTLEDNPDFRNPRSSSGVADLPGGDALITLGAWDGNTASVFVQAATLMHELGHTFWRTHGGAATAAPETNCKPNYLSVMSYLFQ